MSKTTIVYHPARTCPECGSAKTTADRGGKLSTNGAERVEYCTCKQCGEKFTARCRLPKIDQGTRARAHVQ